MIILQAVNGFIYQVQTLAAFSYYPEIARDVGERKMTSYLSDYTVLTFGTQLLYLLIVVSVGYVLAFDDVVLSQVAQAFCVVTAGPVYLMGWHWYFTKRPAARHLSQGDNLIFSGFVQVFKSFKAIWKLYKYTLGYFFVAVILGKAGKKYILERMLLLSKKIYNDENIRLTLHFLLIPLCY